MKNNELETSIYRKVFWNEWKLDPTSTKYNLAKIYSIKGNLHLNKFIATLKIVIENIHSLKSTFFESTDEVIKQRITDEIDFDEVIKFEEIDEHKTETDIFNDLLSEINTVYDLRTYPLFKFIILEIDKGSYLFLSVFHHIIFDGLGADVMFSNISSTYNSLVNEEDYRLVDDSQTYEEYLIYEKENIIPRKQNNKILNYWKDFLIGADLYSELPKLNENNTKKKQDVRAYSFILPENITENLLKFGNKNDYSLFNILASVYSISISKQTSSDDVTIMHPVNMRPKKFANLKCALNNSLPLRVIIDKETTFISIINSIRLRMRKSLRYRYIPISELIQSLKKDNVISRDSIPNVSIVNMLDTSEFELSGLNTTVFKRVPQRGGGDLNLEFGLLDNEIHFQLNYSTDYFDENSIKTFSTHFLNVINSLLINPNLKISDLTLLSDSEYKQIVYDWNKTEASFPSDKTIINIFEEQVRKTPDKIAVVFEDQKLTYRELNKKVNQLAHTIRRDYREFFSDNIRSDTLIGIYIERSLEMLVGILGILKSGAAYVPFDSADPEERLKFKISDCGCKMVLTSISYIKNLTFLAETDTVPLCIDDYWDEIDKSPETNPDHINNSEDLAYIIYTSGSTGKPKGVMIEHHNVINLICDRIQKYNLSSDEKVVLFSSYSFDASVEQIFLTMLSGSTLYIPTKKSIEDINLFGKYLIDNQITHFNTVPVYLATLNKNLDYNFSRIALGGDVCNADLISGWIKKYSIYNNYGPTENTIDSCSHKCDAADVTVPIGRPLNNYSLYILDTSMNPVPIGIAGELYIGGAGIARGYLNRESLTNERFIKNPFVSDKDIKSDKNLKIYKTGDICRWRGDGNIEYIGRNDDQIKIRGFRVELGEIENKFLEHPSISQCVVLCKERSGGLKVTVDKFLVAYYTLENSDSQQSKVQKFDFSDYISSKLPNYMVPSAYIELDKMPVNTSGKIDKKALPDPEFKGDEDNYIAPENDLEKELCDIWQETLGIERIGINDDFFKIGGYSILAIKLSHQMTKQLDKEIPVSAIFKHKTIKSLIESFCEFQNIINIKHFEGDKAPLSFAQERLFFIDEYEGGSNAYNIPLFFELDTNVDSDILKQSIESIVLRHDILRTVFVESDNADVFQKTTENLPYISEVNITESDFESKLRSDINTIFNFREEYPLKVTLYKTESKKYLLINIHHIAFDGWSTDIFLKELNRFYNHLKEGVPLTASKSEIQYRDFAVWQREYLSGERLQTELDYWRQQLNECEILEFPLDRVRPVDVDYNGDYFTFEIGTELSSLVRESAKNNSTTAYTILLGGFYILLQKYSGQNDIIIGTPTANRHYSQLENVLGFFVNSTPLRFKLNPKQDISLLIKDVASAQSSIQAHQDIPFEKIVDALNIPKDSSRHPLFQIMFSVQNFGSTNAQNNSVLKITDVYDSYKIAKFDLSLFVDDFDENLNACFNYAVSLFDRSTIGRLSEHYKNILREVVSAENKRIDEIQLLSENEYEQIVYNWNKTEAPYPEDKTIQSLFEEQVEKTPDNIAVAFEKELLTYKELNKKSNQLARHIRKEYLNLTGEQLSSDTLIPICMERSLDVIVGIFAILKAGGAYVPIDPEYPQDRIDYILEDINAKLLLTQSHLKEKFGIDFKLVAVDIDLFEKYESGNLSVFSSYNDLAYVIYTSGTTGKAKGAMIEHKNILNLLYDFQSRKAIGSEDKGMLWTEVIFDVSVYEIFSTLIFGASLHIVPKKMRFSIEKIIDFLHLNSITSAYIPGFMLENLLQFAKNQEIKLALSRILVGVEPIDSNLLLKISESIENVSIINGYGPTETTVCASLYNVSEKRDGITPIGKPVKNMKLYVLDSGLNPVPIGTKGELYIGGIGVGRGYLNRQELTVERFIDNPFSTREDVVKGYTRLYKTGDLVKWLPDGNIEFVGRNDFQVKINGYRIELGEIESQLSEYVDISECVVLAKENKGIKDKYLVGYYVSDAEIASEELANYLSKTLPVYMIPNVFVHMEEFPFTTNGKLDRKKLPDPEFNCNKEIYVAPNTELEKILCDSWQEILGIEKVGTNDVFFKIGGNSILAIKLSHRMTKQLDKEIPVSAIFKHKTIKSIIESFYNFNNIVNIRHFKGDRAPLSFAQERLLFLEEFESGSNAYNIPLFFKLDSTINSDILIQSIESIVLRHDILRTVFVESDNADVFQKTTENLPYISEVNISESDFESKLRSDINTIFNFREEYPIKVTLYKTESKKYLLINIHHIAFDGWSTDLFLKELNSFYNHLNDSAPLEVSKSEIQYRDFAVWQREYLSGEKLQSELDYWKQELNECEALEFPLDRVRPVDVDYTGDYYTFEIGTELSNQVRECAKNSSTTPYTILLSGFYILLQKYCGQNDIIIGTPTANRHYSQLENVLGFFVNSTPLRFKLNTTLDIRSLIKDVASAQSFIQAHQDIPFEKIVDALNIPKDSSRHPLFQIMFSVQNFGRTDDQNDNALKISEVGDSYKIAKFDLSLFVDDSDENLKACLNYAVSLFDRSTMSRISKHYKNILREMVSVDNKIIDKIQLLSDNEYEQIVYGWNKTEAPYPKDKTIHQLFEEQVEKTPDNIAVVFEDQKLTYLELNKQVNQLAHTLRNEYAEQFNENIESDTLIGLYIERSINMIPGILGIMKSGAAYVPFDSADPEDRLRYKINDCGCRIILTSSDYTRNLVFLTETDTIPLTIDGYEDEISQQSDENPKQINSPSDLAYVIYTSGSTGRPKGVMIQHRGVINLIKRQTEYFEIDSSSKILQFASVSFDAAVSEIFSGLLNGAAMIVASSKEKKDVDSLIDLIDKEEISVATIPPALLEGFPTDNNMSSLKSLVVAGDTCRQNLMNDWAKGRLLINAYGPTETTVCATMHRFEQGDLNTVIGKPIKNSQMYILDDTLKPVPVGVTGELYVGGDGLARGYLKRPELTEERFIRNPFINESNEDQNLSTHIYRTGDLGKWLPDGTIEYLGRNDDQVKIRGFRIELGEIENRLSQHDMIEQCAVICRTRNGKKYLAAYYVSDSEIEVENLIKYLSDLLPDYMVPSFFMQLDSMPINTSGKTDHKALPDPEFKGDESNYVAPESDLEKELCDIWQKLLGLEKIGINDDFFRVGGDSILSIQLSSKLRNSGHAVTVKDIFEASTIKSLAVKINESGKVSEIIAEQGVLEGTFGLLPIQQWFFDSKFEHSNHWNHSFLVKVPELDLIKLEESIYKVVCHHDALRIRFKDGTQYYNETIEIPNLKLLDKSCFLEKQLNDIFTDWQSGFDVTTGPLWQFGYITGYEDGSARLYFALHHLIVDSVSWRILIEDVKKCYEGKGLGKKTSSYRQWVDRVKKYPENNPDEKMYWENIIQSLPDYRTVADKKCSTVSKGFTLSSSVTHQLIKEANTAYDTDVIELMLTAFAYSLKEWQGDSVQGITFEGHGRVEIDTSIDISNTVGWFTNTYPLKLSIKDNIEQTIFSVRDSLRQVPNKGLGFGAFCYNCDNDSTGKTLNDNSLPPIVFNYLGQFDNSEGLWQVSGEPAGIGMLSIPDGNLIMINGMLIENKLNFTVMTKLGENVTEQISQKFKEYIEAVTEQCIDAKKNQKVKKPDDTEFEYVPYLFFNKDSKSKKVIIMIHPGQGGAEAYLSTIYPALSKDVKVIIVDNFYHKVYLKDGVVNLKYDIDKFSDLAEYYVKLLISEQGDLLRNSECVLAGYSFGSIVAIEMVNLLKKYSVYVQQMYLIEPLIPALLKNRTELKCFEWYKEYIPEPITVPVVHFRCTEADPELPEFSEYFIESDEFSLRSIADVSDEMKFRCTHTDILNNSDFVTKFKDKVHEDFDIK